MLRNSQYDSYTEYPLVANSLKFSSGVTGQRDLRRSQIQSPPQSRISLEVKSENSVNEYMDKEGSFDIIFDVTEALSKLIHQSSKETAMRLKIFQWISNWLRD